MGLGGFPTLNRRVHSRPSSTAVRVGFFTPGHRWQVTGNLIVVDCREKSREEWERNLRDVQNGVTPGGWLRADQIMARKLSVSPAPIRNLASLIAFVASCAFLGIAVAIFSSNAPNRVALGSAALLIGFCIAIAVSAHNRRAR